MKEGAGRRSEGNRIGRAIEVGEGGEDERKERERKEKGMDGRRSECWDRDVREEEGKGDIRGKECEWREDKGRGRKREKRGRGRRD